MEVAKLGIIEGFTRRETLDLTETTSNRLQYLERVGLIVPQRIGSSSKPTVIYTWEQILEIRAIKNLRQEISLQTVRKIVDILNKYGFDESLRDKQLIAINDDVFWIRQDWTDFSEQMPKALKVASKKGKNIGQYTLTVIPTLGDIVDEVWSAAKKSKVVDMRSFEQRAKAKSYKVAI
jgi:DNA-binding transcriptional MerR regulator